MLTVKNIRELIKDIDDDTPVVISFNGCINSGTILAVSEMEITTADELLDLDYCGCDEECDCPRATEEQKNKKVLYLYSDREWFELDSSDDLD